MSSNSLKVEIVFFMVLSLIGLPGIAGNNPSGIMLARANSAPCETRTTLGACSYSWIPAGPAVDSLIQQLFTDGTAELTDLQSPTPHIDVAADTPLTPDLISALTANPNYQVSAPQPSTGYTEIQFMLANNFWGCNFNYGNSQCGIEIRQGISHLIDKAQFVATEPSLVGQAQAIDNPLPSDNGGLPTPNPCAWDASFPQSGTNCIVGAPGGAAYHLATATGANGFGWLPSPGSSDLNAAAQHFVNAGIATSFDPSTSILSLSGSQQSTALAHVPDFFIVSSDPARLHLGNGLAEEMCYLFTGNYNVPCSFLSTTYGPITTFPGFTTSTSTVNQNWWMYTANIGGAYPFDNIYHVYNSQFASGISSIQTPSGPCSPSSVPTYSAPDYMYACDPAFDDLTNQMEFSPCLTASGDPVAGDTSNNGTAPNFGKCLGDIGQRMSAVLGGVKSEDEAGKKALTIPVKTDTHQFGALFGPIEIMLESVRKSAEQGLEPVIRSLNEMRRNFFGPIVEGVVGALRSTNAFTDSQLDLIRQGMYDSITVPNPFAKNSAPLFWDAIDKKQLPNSGLSYTPPPGTTASIRVTLRNDMFFQDGRKVTPFDVAFSYLSLKATGAFQATDLEPMTGITILSPSQFDINVNGLGPFNFDGLTSPSILPGRYWTLASPSVWDSSVATCLSPGPSCYPSQYTIRTTGSSPGINCALTCTFPASNMNVDPSKILPTYDPIQNHILVGSGPWECGTLPNIGFGCSSNGTQYPGAGGTFTLTRYGQGLAPGSSLNVYARSNGNLALWIWTGNTGVFSNDFLNFAGVSSCFGKPIGTSGCVQWQQGIGSNGGPVGLTQVSIVQRFVGVNWVAPYDWQVAPPQGIAPFPPVLQEGSVVLNPARIVGCSAAYPAGGYDC